MFCSSFLCSMDYEKLPKDQTLIFIQKLNIWKGVASLGQLHCAYMTLTDNLGFNVSTMTSFTEVSYDSQRILSVCRCMHIPLYLL